MQSSLCAAFLVALFAAVSMPAADAQIQGVEDMNALSGLEGLIGGEFRAILEDMGLIKHRFEKSQQFQMIQLSADKKVVAQNDALKWNGKQWEDSASKKLAEKNPVGSFLQDMEKKFKLRVETVETYEERSKASYEKASGVKKFPTQLKKQAAAMREKEHAQTQQLLKFTKEGLGKVQDALVQVTAELKEKKAGTATTDLVKFATDTSAAIMKEHRILRFKHPHSVAKQHSHSAVVKRNNLDNLVEDANAGKEQLKKAKFLKAKEDFEKLRAKNAASRQGEKPHVEAKKKAAHVKKSSLLQKRRRGISV